MTRASFFAIATGHRTAREGGASRGSAGAVPRSALQVSLGVVGLSPERRTRVRDWAGASALRWIASSALPDRQRLDHRRQLRGLAVLRDAAPAPCRVPCVLLSLHGQPQLQRPRELGRQLDHRDVPARKLGPHPRQHALPGVFGKNVEDAFGPLRYLAFYFAGGFVATMTQTLITLAFGTAAEARVPNLGASGAIAAVLGAYFVLYPNSTVRGLVVIFPVHLSAWFFLGAWFLYQLIEANFGLFGSAANGGGVAFFAHVGGFVF